MNRQQLTAALQKVQVDLIVNSKRYEATRGLFDAACFANDGVLAATLREQVHALTDESLDLVAQSVALSKQLMHCSD